MTGPSGMRPLEVLADRQKCPDSPSKRRYLTSDEAIEAAEKRARETGLPIVAYACAGCGSYHLTKKRGGSDELVPGASIKTRALRQMSPNHPVFSRPTRDLSVLPLSAGNKAARLKLLKDYLTEHPTPTTAEVTEAMGVGRETLRPDLHALGWTVSRGPGAQWKRVQPEADEPIDDEPRRVVPFDVDRVRHIPLGDIVDTLAAAGIKIEFGVWQG